MKISVFVCTVSFVFLLWKLRRSGVSLGIPAAYLANLLILHVPGVIAYIVDRDNLLHNDAATRTGALFTAIGTVAFVVGVLAAQKGSYVPTPTPAARSLFWRYCLIGGGLLTVVAYLVNIPSIGAVLKSGGPIWMLGAMLALRSANQRRDRAKAMRWLAVLAIYPLLILMLTGYMSYGSVAVIIVLTGVAAIGRSGYRVAVTYAACFAVGISIFLGYFENRNEIRAAVWGGADTNARIAVSLRALSDIKLFNPRNPDHLEAFDQRLNQNYFVGLAARRISNGEVSYLYGNSLWEGVQALVPRALWPDKPVEAGSPKIVSQMTGLTLAEGTSFGVGNVMEFHINFGIPGLIIGFLVLGYAMGRLDRRAAEADIKGDLGGAFLFFLPAIALIQPNGSIVEMMSGTASAVAAAYGWRWGWEHWPKPHSKPRMVLAQRPSPQPF